jgi:hypothetical protein
MLSDKPLMKSDAATNSGANNPSLEYIPCLYLPIDEWSKKIDHIFSWKR